MGRAGGEKHKESGKGCLLELQTQWEEEELGMNSLRPHFSHNV